jgi:hypothetical protein
VRKPAPIDLYQNNTTFRLPTLSGNAAWRFPQHVFARKATPGVGLRSAVIFLHCTNRGI